MYFQYFIGTQFPIYHHKKFGCVVGPIHPPIQGLLRAPTPGQHFWANNWTNVIPQSRLNGATNQKIHMPFLNKHGQVMMVIMSVLLQSFEMHTARDQFQQDETADLRLLYRETANNC
jgi:hypothetical protein